MKQETFNLNLRLPVSIRRAIDAERKSRDPIPSMNEVAKEVLERWANRRAKR